MTPRRLVMEAGWPLVVVGAVLLLADPAHSLSDLRIDLLAAMVPVAEGQGLPPMLLPWLLYPLVAANILAPVWLWSWLANGARLRRHLDRPVGRSAPWPRVTITQAGPGLDARRIEVHGQGWPSGAWTMTVLALMLLFALALWGRDQWRQAVMGPDGGVPARLPVAVEVALLWLTARCTWAIGLRHALVGLARVRGGAHGWGGWFVVQRDGALLARRVTDDTAVDPGFAANLARRIRDVV